MFCEALGTFWLLITYGLNTILNTGATPWSAAAALLSMMYSLATASGGYFNPAVTLGVVLSGRSKCNRRDGCLYSAVQVLMAIPVGLFLRYIHSYIPISNSNVGFFAAESVYAWYQIAAIEALFTFLVVYVVLTVTISEAHTSSWPNFYFALAVGFTVVGAAYAASNVSGGYLNPSVALTFAVEGQPVFHSDATVSHWPTYLDTLMRILAIAFKIVDYYLRCFLYWIPEIIGACAAAVMFRSVYSSEYERKVIQ
jgi:aquaporin Z